ncbi:MAG: alpha/beta fold hydrolase [Tardiphaga sp.]
MTIVSIVAIAIGMVQLHNGRADLRITQTTVGDTPVTIFRPASDVPAPVIVIAHGFAGSQQLMQPFAQTLAHDGYIIVTFDFIGHGRNPVPIRGAIGDGETITAQLLRQLGEIVDYGKTLGGDGRLALLGHSMASDIVIRAAATRPDIQATIAVSAFSKAVTAASPRNLLVIVGAWEPHVLKDEGLRMVRLSAGEAAAAGTTYGDFALGTARELTIAGGVEHIGVLYSRDSLTRSAQWLGSAFDRPVSGAIDRRGVWLALMLAGFLALAWPLSHLLPGANAQPVGAGLRWKALLAAALLPAVVTPLLLWKLPTDFLPMLLGDYLMLHFLIYGILTAAVTRAMHAQPMSAPASWRAATVAAVAVALYSLVTIGGILDRDVFSFMPILQRVPLILAVALGTVPYFLADEWLTRGPQTRRGAYALTKGCFLLSLALAIALNPMKLFFLAIIVPALLLLQIVFGLISRWSYRSTRHPLPGALANALVFAWAIGVTFPLIAR